MRSKEMEERPHEDATCYLGSRRAADRLRRSGRLEANAQGNQPAPGKLTLETHPQSATPDRPPATAMPDANKPSPETTGQTPAGSEKMEPGRDTVGGPKTPGEEKM